MGLPITINFSDHIGTGQEKLSTAGSAVRVVEGANNGDNYIELKAPATLGGNLTYTLPATNATNGILQNDGSGGLSWMTSGTLVGPITISDTTDSTTKDTGALIVEGGVGIEKRCYSWCCCFNW